MALCTKTSTRTTTAVAKQVDLLEKYHEPKVCDILPTSPTEKLDIFDEFRPKPRTVLDYSISQTDTKIQRRIPIGVQKLHVQQTCAEYELPPVGYVFPAEAPPPPPPPTPPKIKFSTGRGPVWAFLDDTRKKKIEKQQEIYKKRLKEHIKQRKKSEAEAGKRLHAKAMELVGPEWFQELSPQQLRTVDDLKNCIVKDVKNKTIENTQENIAQLGLVLRPDHRHIQIALRRCCECPVEFLLILYQLMNRHRTEYSLNDRLLLSSVAHLTVRETLKELHIRIPSPPPLPSKEVTKSRKRKKKPNYKSPYLVPFTFKPEKPKHTGIYKNNHIQYPESPYFSYKNELVKEIYDEATDEQDTLAIIQDPIEKEMLDELRVAQREYGSLVNYKPVPRLHKCSIYVPCDHGLKLTPETSAQGEGEKESDTETNISVAVRVKVTTDFDECHMPIKKTCECTIALNEQKISKSAKMEEELQAFIINGVTYDRQKNVVFIIGGIVPPAREESRTDMCPCGHNTLSSDGEPSECSCESLPECNCERLANCPCEQSSCHGQPLHCDQRLPCTQPPCCAQSLCHEQPLGSGQHSSCGQPSCCGQSLRYGQPPGSAQPSCYYQPSSCGQPSCSKQSPCCKQPSGCGQLPTCGPPPPCQTRPRSSCPSKQPPVRPEKILSLCPRERHQAPGEKESKVPKTSSETVTENAFASKKPSMAQEEVLVILPPDLSILPANDGLLQVGKRPSNECKCKAEAEKIISTNLCQCERCKADREAARLSKTKYIIAGMAEVTEYQRPQNDEETKPVLKSTEVVRVVGGVKEKKPCDCLQKYQARVEMYEKMKKRFDVQHDLKTIDQKFVVGGMTYAHTGEPVYLLGGVVPEKECPCVETYQEQLKDHERLANMPKIPLGKQKYLISGVQRSENGNVFVVGGTVAGKDCPCMEMYKKFKARHQTCLEAYQVYLEKIELDKQQYMTEIAQDKRFSSFEPEVREPNVPSSPNYSQTLEAASVEVGFQEKQSSDTMQSEESTCPCAQQVACPRAEPPVCTCPSEDNYELDTTLNITLSIKNGKIKRKKQVCICDPANQPDYTLNVCQKINSKVCVCGGESSESEEEPEAKPEPELKRFILLNKIPCDYPSQLEILKKALSVMADDGFPLAKLPDCHKLPIFKLWMQLRCGKYWTMKDREALLMRSTGCWRHTDFCSRKVLVEQAASRREFTWAHAKIVKEIASEKVEKHYRKVKQAAIGDSREFFPTLMSYELPTYNFRDCYFAYTPAKEEECLTFRPWYQHEMKNMSRRKPCM